MNNNNETTIKKSAKRSRYGLRISYEDLKTLIDTGSRELSDSQVLKALKLALGVDKYLSDDHCYYEDRWPQLARELKLRSVDELIDIVEQSGLFFIDQCADSAERCFYYLEYKRFHDHCDNIIIKQARAMEKARDKAMMEHMSEVVEEIKETFDCVEVCEESGAISTRNPREIDAKSRNEEPSNTQTANEIGEPRARVGKGIGNKGDISLPEISPLVKDLDAALSACVGRLWKAEGPDGQLHCVRKQLLELLSLQEEESALSKVAFGYLVRMTLVDHFNRQRHQAERPRDFCKQTEAGQDAWLKSLMGSKYIASLLKQCVKDVRPLIAQAQHEQRHQHPNGEFEWYDPVDAKRYYDDPTEGVMEIPSDLPPRPDAAAVIHPLTKQWYMVNE